LKHSSSVDTFPNQRACPSLTAEGERRTEYQTIYRQRKRSHLLGPDEVWKPRPLDVVRDLDFYDARDRPVYFTAKRIP
jgi:hypothetical protein